MRASRRFVEVGLEVSVCGEMASDPRAVLLLIGLGYRVLSIAPPRVARARWVVRQLDCEEAEAVAREAIAASTTPEIESLLDAGVSELVSDDLLPLI